MRRCPLPGGGDSLIRCFEPHLRPPNSLSDLPYNSRSTSWHKVTNREIDGRRDSNPRASVVTVDLAILISKITNLETANVCLDTPLLTAQDALNLAP
jgi:hypothetical protein